jgi:Domain of unknown function (DUF4965)/Domain of unknown function (DUF5127)/Domain of unknown function (DUF1793)/Domain of unknown function (DUF4964)
MKQSSFSGWVLGALLFCGVVNGADFRPPAVPLIAHDPYFSIWSFSDRLNESQTKHWTGATNSLVSLIRVDGTVYRLMGNEPRSDKPLAQTGLKVLPTHTIYSFAGAGVSVRLTFMTPALPKDLDVLSRPATYVTWRVESTDGKPHETSVYFDAGGEIPVNRGGDPVEWSRFQLKNATALRMGSAKQAMLERSGDDLRIEWGYLYVAAENDDHLASFVGTRPAALKAFAETGGLPAGDDLATMQPYAQPTPVLAYSFSLGAVSAAKERMAVVAYDDLYSVEYFHRRLRPWWRQNGAEASDMLAAAIGEYRHLEDRCRHFDDELMRDLTTAGGEKYAELCALAFRQTLAAHKLVADIDGTPLYFSKENFSNGSIDTVDVTYPSSPFFLLFNTKLLRGQVQPILDYASMARWRFPFAPHDLGRYPLANGQQYGAGEASEEDQMPVEESGNMLIMVAAMARIDGDTEFAKRYWRVLTKWAEYLKEKGLDPENQLCTDDFAGHLAHNTNLSLKAIVALGAYGQLAALAGHPDIAAQYGELARTFASRWAQMALDGDHYRLAFDRPGTWSQKYNLVWDHILQLNLFPAEVTSRELAFYATHSNEFGLPLDNRATYTKIDWLTWTASLTRDKAGFEQLFDPAYHFADASTSRVPLTDWYDTVTGKQVGFQARSVVGGIFIQMLSDPAMSKRWGARTE